MSKRNLNKVPKDIRSKLDKISSQQIVAGCAKTFSSKALKEGAFSHLGIKLDEEGLHIPESMVPPIQRGKYSRRNSQGQEVVRKDLPMETYSVTFDAPNFGDSSKGTHDVTWTKERYIREFIAPTLAQIKMESRVVKAITETLG